MSVTLDSRDARRNWLVTSGRTAIHPVQFLDSAGDVLPVDTWVFSSRVLPLPGRDEGAVVLTVDVTQASVGLVWVVADDSATEPLNGRYSWVLSWVVAGEPTGGIAGSFVAEPEGIGGAVTSRVTS